MDSVFEQEIKNVIQPVARPLLCSYLSWPTSYDAIEVIRSQNSSSTSQSVDSHL